MKVWILQTGEPLHIDVGNPRPMRAMNLANALVEAGHNVVLWSSAFYHQEKQHRSRDAARITISEHLEIRLIPSPGYMRNIGLGRLWDHAVLARNLCQLLNYEPRPPDVAFIGYPPIEVAAIASRWLFSRKIPFLLDIKDQWPKLFVDALPRPLRPLGHILFSPYFYFAKRAMRDASGLSAMAEDFLNWAIDFAGRQRTDLDRVVSLTTPRGQVAPADLIAMRQWWDSKGIVEDGRWRVCFVGSHSPAFDILPLYHAAKHFSSNNNYCEFVICGDGECSTDWRNLMSALPNVHFPGWVDRAQIEALAERSHASLAPYRNIDNFTQNLPNKVIDSLSLGLPILSPLKGEVAKLISSHNIGLAYGEETERTLANCIDILISNRTLCREISRNAINLYQEKFSFEIVYGGLVEHLEMLNLKKEKGVLLRAA
jgi:glycosyltransferase involved in cell wall biosynthesis